MIQTRTGPAPGTRAPFFFDPEHWPGFDGPLASPLVLAALNQYIIDKVSLESKDGSLVAARVRMVACLLFVLNPSRFRSCGAFLLCSFLSAQGQVIISELMYHSAPAKPESTALEWLELYNRTTNAINLADWRFTKGIGYVFPSVTLPPDGRLVIAADVDVFRQNYPGVSNVVGGWSGKLRNDGETIELTGADGRAVTSVRYYKEGDWALRRVGTPYPGHPEWWRGWEWFTAADGQGASLELVDESLPITHGQNWAASKVQGGTPGAANSVGTDRSAPLISNVRHFPPIPAPTAEVWISATITARLASEPAQATLFYRLDSSAPFVAVPMHNDGLHHDGAAEDSLWGCMLPAHPDKTIVEFYVEARQTDLRRTWPAPTDDLGTQGANALYQVDSAIYSGVQPMYRMIIRSNDWADWTHLMDHVSRGAYSDAQMNATVVRQDGSGTQIYYLAGLRNRGAGTRSANPHNLHLSIPQDRVGDGASRLNFNTRTVHSQAAGNAILSSANLINAYGAPVQVRINGTNQAHSTPDGSNDSYQFGMYYCFESYDSDWAAAHVPSDAGGNLYKGVWYVDGVRLKRGADLEYLGEEPVAYQQRYAETGPTSDSGPYSKQSNVVEDDWSDLIALTRAFSTNTPDAEFISSINHQLNVEQWLRFIAVNSLILNMETTLATGAGDDISMYRGVSDPRFLLLNHDLDTVLGQGDSSPSWTRSIFKAADLPALSRLLKHPDIAPRYFQALNGLAETTFSTPVLNRILRQSLGGWVPSEYIEAMRNAAERRRTNVLEQIPTRYAVASPSPVSNGFHVSTNGLLPLVGTANAIDTRKVLVNGSPASYTPWQGTWSRSDTTLHPGLNRILIQFLAQNGSEVARTNLDAWFDTGRFEPAAALVTGHATWTAAAGPYYVASSLKVQSGATLSIEPGTTVFFGDGAKLIVSDGARLVAAGTEIAPIWFGPPPGSMARWQGVEIYGSEGSPETVLAHVIVQGNSGPGLLVKEGAVEVAHTSFRAATQPCLILNGASFLIRDAEFPVPAANVPVVWGTNGIRTDGRGVIRDSFFSAGSRGAGVVLMNGGRRGRGEPVLHFVANVCLSAADDLLVLNGADAWVEGNQFLHAHRQPGTEGASAVRLNSIPEPSSATLIRNLLYDCDRGVTLEAGCSAVLVQNTILRTRRADEVEGGAAIVALVANTDGTGALLERNVIWDVETIAEGPETTTPTVVLNQNLLPAPWAGPGVSNLVGAPLLLNYAAMEQSHFKNWASAQASWTWTAPTAASPAKNAVAGRDLGASVPTGILISPPVQNPSSPSDVSFAFDPVVAIPSPTASAYPDGAGYTHYRWRLDEGPWSPLVPATHQLVLRGLGDGAHRLSVIGRRDSASLQDDEDFSSTSEPTVSTEWNVSTDRGHVRLNEVLAWATASSGSDAIELYNPTSFALDLSGCRLTDDLAEPNRYVFPLGTTLGSGQFLVVEASHASGPTSLGFGLDRQGDSVYLVDSPLHGGGILDQVTFGLQARGYSLGRLGDGTWALGRPTLGSMNVAEPLDTISSLRINEWLTEGSGTHPQPFVELYNPAPAPVSLAGLRVSDAPAGSPEGQVLPPLSFIGPRDFVVVMANGGTGESELEFTRSEAGGALGIFSPVLEPIDTVVFGPQRPGVSVGRAPDGSESIDLLPLPTPGTPNPVRAAQEGTNNVVEIVLMPITNTWRFSALGSAPDSNWHLAGFADTGWAEGAALLGHDPSSPYRYPEPLRTELPMEGASGEPVITYYFRSAFVVETNLAGFSVHARVLVDDGAVFYLNGERIANLRLTNNPVFYEDRARNQSNEGTIEIFEIPVERLLLGTNVLAVEVHQTSASSSDVAFAMSLVASRIIPPENPLRLVLNEVLASNFSFRVPDGALCDWIEIANPASTRADLSGSSLSDTISTPRRWIFPAGVIVEPGGVLVVKFDPSSAPSYSNSGVLNTGFGLDASGDSVLLFDSKGKLLDSVVFGVQAADLSIGRPSLIATEWMATVPSPGEANVLALLGSPNALSINEWAASVSDGSDWFELFNPDSAPVQLDGLYLTDSFANPDKHRVAPLSFIGTGVHGFTRFFADGAVEAGPDHVSFSLSAAGENLAIFSNDEQPAIDSVSFGSQTSGRSQGRYPDGATAIVQFLTPSPGRGNSVDADGDGIPDGWEILHGLNPLLNDGREDQDGDGASNLNEFLSGTDPRDMTSSLSLDVTIKDGTLLQLQFTAVPKRPYSIYYSNLGDPRWRLLQGVTPQPEKTVVTINDDAGTGTKFYRLATPAAP